MQQHLRKFTVRGFTMVEQLVALTVVTSVAGIAGTGLSSLQDSQRLMSALSGLRIELQHARSLATARNEVVRIGFARDATCMVVHTGPSGSCDCSAAGSECAGGHELRTLRWDGGVAAKLLSRGSRFAFDGEMGTTTPTATIELTNASGQSVRLVVNVMGRMRSCTPDGSVRSQPAC